MGVCRCVRPSRTDPNMAQPAAWDSENCAEGTPNLAFLPRIPPEKLEFSTDRGESFRAWKTRWSDYALLSGPSNQPPDIRMAVLRSCLSDEALKVVANLELPERQRTDTESVLQGLESYALGQVNCVLQRRTFNLRCQKEGESFDDFLTDLRDLSNSCDFCGTCRESLIRDRVVVGIRNPDVIKRLCAVTDLTLSQAVQICRANEAASRDALEIIGTDVAVCRTPARVRDREPGVRQDGRLGARTDGRSEDGDRPTSPCRKCGLVHRRDDRCPARGRHCFRCGLLGHFSSVCRAQTSGDVRYMPNAMAVTDASACLPPADELAGRRDVTSPCRRCGLAHRRGERCPARDRECKRCGGKGHFSSVCSVRVSRDLCAVPNVSAVTAAPTRFSPADAEVGPPTEPQECGAREGVTSAQLGESYAEQRAAFSARETTSTSGLTPGPLPATAGAQTAPPGKSSGVRRLQTAPPEVSGLCVCLMRLICVPDLFAARDRTVCLMCPDSVSGVTASRLG